MKLLHIIATPRENVSNTLRVSNSFLDSLRTAHPDLIVEELHVFNQTLPAVAGDNIETKYSLMVGQPINKNHKESWEQIETIIKQFMSADLYLISTPMWNFSIPYALKYYIDAVVQPGYLFRYNEQGYPVPLVLGKKMLCITSRGGDYSDRSPLHVFDFQEPYLRSIFGFVGITDMQFINVQPVDINLNLREMAVAAATVEARKLAESWVNHVSQIGDMENQPGLKPRPITV